MKYPKDFSESISTAEVGLEIHRHARQALPSEREGGGSIWLCQSRFAAWLREAWGLGASEDAKHRTGPR